MPAKKMTDDEITEQEAPADDFTGKVSAPEPVEVSSVRPTRLEAFSIEGKWGYRAVDDLGTVARESVAEYEDADKALRAAKTDHANDDLTLPSDAPGSRFGWR